MIDPILELDLSADRAKLRPTMQMGQRRANALAPATERMLPMQHQAIAHPLAERRRPVGSAAFVVRAHG
jgi:hypothetical protein